MKRVVALLVIAILLISTIAPVFAGPDTCPVDGCNGTFRKYKYKKDWHWVTDWSTLHRDSKGNYWVWRQEEREIYICCSKKTHTRKEVRFAKFVHPW